VRTVDHKLTQEQIHQILPENGGAGEESANICTPPSATSATQNAGNLSPYWNKEHDIFLFKCAFDTRLDWKKTAKRITKETGLHATPAQVRDRYHSLKTQSKGFKRDKLGFDDDVKLFKIIKESGLDWEKINTSLPDFSPLVLRNRIYNKIKKDKKYQQRLESAILAQ